MLVFWTVWKLKTPRLRGFATPIGATLRENVESVESGCLEAGGALRLKLNENFNENCIDAGLLHTNYRELTANYHLIIGGISGIGGIGGIGGITWFT